MKGAGGSATPLPKGWITDVAITSRTQVIALIGAIFWDMIRAGQQNSISEVVARMNRDWGEIRFRYARGMSKHSRTPQPPVLTTEEREQILAGVSAGRNSIREIARGGGRAPESTPYEQ